MWYLSTVFSLIRSEINAFLIFRFGFNLITQKACIAFLSFYHVFLSSSSANDRLDPICMILFFFDVIMDAGCGSSKATPTGFAGTSNLLD